MQYPDTIKRKEQRDTNEKTLHLLLDYVRKIYSAKNETIETIKGEFKVSTDNDGLHYIDTKDYEQCKKVLKQLPTYTNEEVIGMNDKLNGQE